MVKIQATFQLILLGDLTRFSNGWVNETRHDRSFIMEHVLYVVVCLRLIDTFNLNEIFTVISRETLGKLVEESTSEEGESNVERGPSRKHE